MEPVEEENEQVQTLENLGFSMANYNSIYMLDNEERLKKLLFRICLYQIVVNKLIEKFSEYTSKVTCVYLINIYTYHIQST